ncbi:MAG: CPBP family intramembrane metalloprotease [Propionibacteriaceae bacterium]|jgi:membrane protease YdiL (CAAX protease family)|nr:CPBP family intramembrane metalloprotease [Propionibacteriaceae bacterium]
MTLYELVRESRPTLRDSDRLTPDHPLRPYPPLAPLRASAGLRAGAFAVVLVTTLLLATSVAWAIAGSYTLSPTSFVPLLDELIAAIVAYGVLVFVMEARLRPYELLPRRAPGLLKGGLVGAVCISVAVGLLALVGVYRITGVNPAYDPWTDLLTLGLAAAVAEEIIFRGVLFRLVEEGVGTWGAVAVSALVFGLLHLTNSEATVWGAVAIAVEAGILFAAVYVITRSLWWCIGLHFAWNVMEGPVFGSVVSGAGTQESWFVSTWTGPDWLTGGQFGLEASVVPVILLGALGVALLLVARHAGIIVSPMWVRKRILSPGPAAPAPGPAR